MSEHVKFKCPTTYWGRNRSGNCLGVRVEHVRAYESEPAYVSLRPVNTKGTSCAAELEIPVEQLEEFIAALRAVACKSEEVTWRS